jgi:hypothetical protein
MPFTKYKMQAANKVDAIQITAENLDEIATLVGGQKMLASSSPGMIMAPSATSIPNSDYVLVPTIDGVVPAGIGSWIARDKNNRIKVIAHADFTATYEVV